MSFKRNQRVNVPGQEGIEGEITERREATPAITIVRWRGDDGNEHDTPFNDADLIWANGHLFPADAPTFTDYRALKWPDELKTDTQRAGWLRSQEAEIGRVAEIWEKSALFNDNIQSSVRASRRSSATLPTKDRRKSHGRRVKSKSKK